MAQSYMCFTPTWLFGALPFTILYFALNPKEVNRGFTKTCVALAHEHFLTMYTF